MSGPGRFAFSCNEAPVLCTIEMSGNKPRFKATTLHPRYPDKKTLGDRGEAWDFRSPEPKWGFGSGDLRVFLAQVRPSFCDLLWNDLQLQPTGTPPGSCNEPTAQWRNGCARPIVLDGICRESRIVLAEDV